MSRLKQSVALALTVCTLASCTPGESVNGLVTDQSEEISRSESALAPGPGVVTQSGSVGSFKVTGVATGNASCTAFNTQIETKRYTFGPNGEVNSEWVDYIFNYCNVIDGGEIRVRVSANGQTKNFDPLLVNLIHGFWQSNSAVPAGGNARIEAVPYAGCTFGGWREAGRSIFTTSSTFFHYSTTPHKEYIGEFHCSGGGTLL